MLVKIAIAVLVVAVAAAVVLCFTALVGRVGAANDVDTESA